MVNDNPLRDPGDERYRTEIATEEVEPDRGRVDAVPGVRIALVLLAVFLVLLVLWFVGPLVMDRQVRRKQPGSPRQGMPAIVRP